jgi:flagellar biosynthesis chaperone FliJ
METDAKLLALEADIRALEDERDQAKARVVQLNAKLDDKHREWNAMRMAKRN